MGMGHIQLKWVAWGIYLWQNELLVSGDMLKVGKFWLRLLCLAVEGPRSVGITWATPSLHYMNRLRRCFSHLV